MNLSSRFFYLLLEFPYQDSPNVIPTKALSRHVKSLNLSKKKDEHILRKIHLQPAVSIPSSEFSGKIKVSTQKILLVSGPAIGVAK